MSAPAPFRPVCCLLLSVLLCMGARLGAQEPGDRGEMRPVGPAAGTGWSALGHGGLVLAGLFFYDAGMRTAALDARGDVVGDVAETAEWFGDWQASLPFLAGGTAAVGGLTDGARGLQEGLAVLGGIVAGSMVNESINQAVGRSRPSEGRGPLALDPFQGHASFPSGHTAFAFSAAAGIDAVTESWAPAAAAYGIAGLTGLSRVYHDRHWLTDVVAGAAVGTVVSRYATKRLQRLLAGGPGEERQVAGAADPSRPGGEETGRPDPGTATAPRLRLLATPGRIGLQLRF